MQRVPPHCLSEYSPPHRCSAIRELQGHPLPRSLALSCDFETSLALTGLVSKGGYLECIVGHLLGHVKMVAEALRPSPF